MKRDKHDEHLHTYDCLLTFSFNLNSPINLFTLIIMSEYNWMYITFMLEFVSCAVMQLKHESLKFCLIIWRFQETVWIVCIDDQLSWILF